ncbi:MAG: serine/threonine protein kinase [Chlamydiales bacterium]|jgi:serine/threonine protein kinase
MTQQDVQFLALLVHRGHLERGDAERLLPALKAGDDLDELLIDDLGWSEKKTRGMRRTRAGEEPEIPGYEILGRLGVGGTAEVFRARDKKTGRPVALKILNARGAASESMLKDFVCEAKMLKEMDHPNLVKGMGVAKSGNTYFCRLELIQGQTLLEHLDEGQVFEEQMALRIVLETAEALKYMAAQNLVHRDIKAGNIMLTQNGQVKVIDLGFCAEQNSCNAEDSAVGTVAYLSPEQAQGGASADFRSDIYSLGVTLFHMVVGRLPFEGSDDREVLAKQVMESLSSPELKGRGLSPHLHYFIEKMMAKDVKLRYQSWDELTNNIREQLDGRDSLDYARTARQKVRRTVPRRR